MAEVARRRGPVVRGHSIVIVLHGALAKRYGRRHRLGARSAAEAAYAMCRMVPGFEEDFRDARYRIVRGPTKTGVQLSEAMLALLVPDGGEIHFIPQARGGKHAGGAKMIIGAVVLVAAVALSYGAALAAAAPGTSVGLFSGLSATAIGPVAGLNVSYGSIAFFGATMFMSGVASLLSQSTKTTDPRASFGFSGATNSAMEGSPLPVVYGRVRVGSVVGSFGYTAEDYDPNAVTTPDDQAGATAGSSGAIGSGGGKSGVTSGGASEMANTLESTAVIRVIDILSEGPIGGLVNGAESIYFNNTPLMANDGSYNFQGVTWQLMTGEPDQSPVPGFSAAEQTIQVGVQIQQGYAGPIIRTYTSDTADALRVTMQIPALYHQSADNGDIQTYPSLEYIIEVRPYGTNTWTQVVDQVFTNQKCTSPYQISHRFDLPGAGTTVTSWDVRVTRITADPTLENDQCSTFWLATTIVTDQPLAYPNVAYIALTVDASAFGTQIPTRSYEIEGILCQIPANYDPVNGVYATSGPGTSLGTWDGYTWQASVTNNPAWCLYDLLSNGRYGLGLPASALNYTKFDLYPISQYCDGSVPTGFNDANGNPTSERRYLLNVQVNTQVDAYSAIQAMVSAFRGMSYWGAGRVVVTADMPTYPSTLTTQANVIDGSFTYEGASLKSRHTVAKVSWLDPDNSYQQTIEVVQDFDAVISLGQIEADIVAFGCTSRGLARRWGKWLLYTERYQTELVSFGVGLEHLRVRPGDVTRIVDPAYAGVRMGGRTRGGSTTTVVKLDAEITQLSGLDYYLSVTLPDGSIADRIQLSAFSFETANGSTYSDAHLSSAMDLAPDVNAAWVLISSNPATPDGSGDGALVDRQFRILALAEPQAGQYQVSGLFHDPNKYAEVELGLKFDPAPYSTLNGLLVTPLPAPSNVTATAYLTGVGTTTILRTLISFTPATDPRVASTQVQSVGPEMVVVNVASGTTATMDNLQLGTYTFQARSVGRDGRTSIWVDSPDTVLDGAGSLPDTPTAFTAQGGAMQVQLSWNLSTARNVLQYEIWRAAAQANGTHPFPSGYNVTGTPEANSGTLLAIVTGNTYTDANAPIAPDTGWAYWIRAESSTHQYSGFAGPVTAVTTYYLTDNLEQGIRDTAPIAQALLGSAPAAYQSLAGITGTTDGQLALQASDGKLYRWNASADNGTGAWELYVAVVPNALGQIADASIASVDATKIAGSFTSAQAASVVAAIATGAITDTMIAGLAGSKVSGQLSNATMQAGQLYDVDPITGQPVVGVDVAKLLGQIGTTQISDNAITSQQIGANQVTAAALAAGAVTANTLAIAGPGNVIGNPCCPATAWGWYIATAGSVSGDLQVGSVTGDGIVSSSYALAGEGSGVLTTSGTIGSNGDSLQAYWDPDNISGVQCNPGDWWEAQAYVGCQRCYGRVGLQFWDGNGNFIGGGTEAYSGRLVGLVGGSTLAAFSFGWTKAQVPAGAVRVRMVIEALNDNGSDIVGGTPGSNAVLVFTRAVLAPSTSVTIAQGATPQPYTIGGVTQVVGGAIKTDAITTRQLSAGSVGAEQLSVGSVSSVITNSCCTVAASGWSSGGALAAVALYSQWLLAGYGTGQVYYGGLQVNQNVDTSWAPDGAPYAPDGTNDVPWSAAVACTPGEVWEAQAQVITSYCSCETMVAFLAQATDGTWQVAATFTSGAQAWAVPANGTRLGNYNQQYIRGTAPGAGTYGGKSCPNGATLVTMVLRMGNGAAAAGVFGAATQNGTLYFTQTGLGVAQTASAPMTWSPGGSTQIQGGTIRTGTIVAGALAAGSVTAANIVSGSITSAQIAAGTITAANLAVGTPSNVIWNSCPDQGTDGWSFSTTGGIGTPNDGVNFMGTAASINPNFQLSASGSIISQNYEGPLIYSTQGHYWDWNPTGVPGLAHYGVAVQGGHTYGASVSAIAGNNAVVALQLFWIDYAGNVISTKSSTQLTNNSQGVGVLLANYTLLTAIDIAPANAATCLFRMLMVGTPAGAASPYMAFTQAQFGPIPDGSTAVGPYQPGGVTTISGGMIKTNTLAANRITAASITSTQIAAGSVSADRLVANSITAGEISAGAIGAAQIAAGAIETTHLAADFALISSAQIGTAVIQSAQIANLAVGTQALIPGSSTRCYTAYSSGGGGNASLVVGTYLPGATDASVNGILLVYRCQVDAYDGQNPAFVTLSISTDNVNYGELIGLEPATGGYVLTDTYYVPAPTQAAISLYFRLDFNCGNGSAGPMILNAVVCTR